MTYQTISSLVKIPLNMGSNTQINEICVPLECNLMLRHCSGEAQDINLVIITWEEG